LNPKAAAAARQGNRLSRTLAVSLPFEINRFNCEA
jgi:hypothetical protein